AENAGVSETATCPFMEPFSNAAKSTSPAGRVAPDPSPARGIFIAAEENKSVLRLVNMFMSRISPALHPAIAWQRRQPVFTPFFQVAPTAVLQSCCVFLAAVRREAEILFHLHLAPRIIERAVKLASRLLQPPRHLQHRGEGRATRRALGLEQVAPHPAQ